MLTGCVCLLFPPWQAVWILAKGTVTRAYKDLEREGYLSLTQGRGSFVNYDLRAEKANEPSRKEVASNAIEKLLSELQNLNFSRREMQIFLDLKMREFFEEKSYAQVAVISDTWEDRSILYKELGDYSHVQFNFFSIIDVLQGEIDPGSFRAFFITEDVYEIAKLHLNLNESRFIRPVCFKLSEHSLIELATLPQNNRVGILCYSERFGKQMQDSLEEFSGLASSAQVQLLRRPGLETLLENCQIVIFPYSCFIYLADKEKAALDSFISKGGKLLDYRMVPERASILNIRTCIEALADYGKEHL